MRYYMGRYSIIVLFAFIAGIVFQKPAEAISIKEEEELSREFMKVVMRDLEIIDDPVIVNYVRTIGRRILKEFPPQPFQYQFYVIKQDVYNAFAAPGGLIFVNSGLIEAMDDESELAGILAHEISHEACRHISQKIERSKKIGWATLAGLAAGVFLGAGGSAAAAQAVTIGTMAAGQSMSLAYSRDDEIQADQLGMTYLYRAGYDGKGMLSILKKIRAKQWFGTDIIPDYLTTHPAVEDRIAYIGAWIERTDPPVKPASQGDGYHFKTVHMRLMAKYAEPTIVSRQLRNRLEKDPDDALTNHGYALFMERNGKRQEAIRYFKKALEKQAFNPYILTDLGRLYFIGGQYGDALKTIEGSISIKGNYPESLFYLGRIQLLMGRFEAAITTLETLSDDYPDYRDVLFFLGEAYEKNGQMDEAHYYLGIHHFRKQEFRTARFHLEKALNMTRDPERKEIIEKLLHQGGTEKLRNDKEGDKKTKP